MKMSPEDRMKKDNVMGLFKNPSTRPIVFFTVAIVIGLIGLSILRMGKADEDIESSASVARTTSAEHRPGVNTSAEHTRLQQEANRRALEEAKVQGQSSLPSLTGDSTVNEPLVLPEDDAAQSLENLENKYLPEATPPQPVVQEVAPITPVPVLQQPVVVQEAPPVASPSNEVLNQQILGYLNLWGPKNTVYQEYVYAGKASKDNSASVAPVANTVATNGMMSNQVGANTTAQATSEEKESSIRYVRAGTMIPAVLITPLNSDAPGPVLAEIQSGPLAGARLLGNMQVSKESLLVSFSQISKPGWPDVYPVSAIGMDLRSSTALATDVNHHYLQKYLGILAGSYMQGYGEGMQQQEELTIVDPNGNIIQDQGELNSRQIAKKAQGTVLGNVGEDILSRTEKDVTIKVEGEQGQPYPIKVLFLGNF